jgi:hypothetical protein
MFAQKFLQGESRENGIKHTVKEKTAKATDGVVTIFFKNNENQIEKFSINKEKIILTTNVDLDSIYGTAAQQLNAIQHPQRVVYVGKDIEKKISWKKPLFHGIKTTTTTTHYSIWNNGGEIINQHSYWGTAPYNVETGIEYGDLIAVLLSMCLFFIPPLLSVKSNKCYFNTTYRLTIWILSSLSFILWSLECGILIALGIVAFALLPAIMFARTEWETLKRFKKLKKLKKQKISI